MAYPCCLVGGANDGLVLSFSGSARRLNGIIELERLRRLECVVLYGAIYMVTVSLTCGVTKHTVGRLQQGGRSLAIFNVGLELFGQVAVPCLCHLQYEQKKLNLQIKQEILQCKNISNDMNNYIISAFTSEYKE